MVAIRKVLGIAIQFSGCTAILLIIPFVFKGVFFLNPHHRQYW